jgi:hypothetical protein
MSDSLPKAIFGESTLCDSPSRSSVMSDVSCGMNVVRAVRVTLIILSLFSVKNLTTFPSRQLAGE